MDIINNQQNNLQIGNWYTFGKSGFWQLMKTIPKFASFDCSSSKNGFKKGDLIGTWCIIKKAFTSKMKDSISVEFTDSRCLSPVSADIKSCIESFFVENPEYKARFEHTDNTPKPSITNIWLTLTTPDEEKLYDKSAMLPPLFTIEQYMEIMQLNQDCIHKPPATHLLNLYGYPWELTAGYEQLFFKSEIIRLKQ